MTNIEETKNKVDHLLSDRGLVEEYKEQAVRLLLFHLFVAIDIYRYMTFAEKNKAGYRFRVFKGSFSLTGFLKERKRKREKKKSPLHPSYKETESEYKEKDENNIFFKGGENSEKRQKAIATEREEANAKLEQEIRERKAGAVSYEEYLKLKSDAE